MKADYKNWVPKRLLAVCGAAVVIFAAAAAFAGYSASGSTGAALCAFFAALSLISAAFTVWLAYLRRQFSYEGSRKLSKTIVERTAEFVTLPPGGRGLDVGCGSGALTIAAAKRNPQGHMVGVDIWGGVYKDSFSKSLCERNAAAEGVGNVSFSCANALDLPFDDESFDAVTSNYVYHNIAGNRQKMLLETLRVLKKGSCFAIHDLMSKSRYGNMQGFISKLREMGYEKAELINTADGLFIGSTEAKMLFLADSRLLTGKK
ncbi:MAG: class I SAM-dependent methyltransferase [Synergistes sp.]|nr:class I SAM-dependent methyltransferase [Synergistes sp.]